tara:strand:- start:2799 stop:7241 length:4443 start_codon:yes stop_codon:yes gene_type:complete
MNSGKEYLDKGKNYVSNLLDISKDGIAKKIFDNIVWVFIVMGVLTLFYIVYLLKMNFNVSNKIRIINEEYANFKKFVNLDTKSESGKEEKYDEIEPHKHTLCDVYIISSASSYLVGWKILDFVSMEMVLTCIKYGARYIEIDINLNQNNQLVVANGIKEGKWILTFNEIDLDEFCKSLSLKMFNKDYFINSKDPLILYLNINSPKNRMNAIYQYFYQNLKAHLLDPKYNLDGEENVLDLTLDKLYNKLIIICNGKIVGTDMTKIVNLKLGDRVKRLTYDEMLETDEKESIEFNTTNLTIVEQNYSIKGLNGNPRKAFDRGCQIFAMNFQRADTYMIEYLQMFYGKSFQLKPFEFTSFAKEGMIGYDRNKIAFYYNQNEYNSINQDLLEGARESYTDNKCCHLILDSEMEEHFPNNTRVNLQNSVNHMETKIKQLGGKIDQETIDIDSLGVNNEKNIETIKNFMDKNYIKGNEKTNEILGIDSDKPKEKKDITFFDTILDTEPNIIKAIKLVYYCKYLQLNGDNTVVDSYLNWKTDGSVSKTIYNIITDQKLKKQYEDTYDKIVTATAEEQIIKNKALGGELVKTTLEMLRYFIKLGLQKHIDTIILTINATTVEEIKKEIMDGVNNFISEDTATKAAEAYKADLISTKNTADIAKNKIIELEKDRPVIDKVASNIVTEVNNNLLEIEELYSNLSNYEEKTEKEQENLETKYNDIIGTFNVNNSISDVEDYLSSITDTNIKILNGTTPPSKFIDIINDTYNKYVPVKKASNEDDFFYLKYYALYQHVSKQARKLLEEERKREFQKDGFKDTCFGLEENDCTKSKLCFYGENKGAEIGEKCKPKTANVPFSHLCLPKHEINRDNCCGQSEYSNLGLRRLYHEIHTQKNFIGKWSSQGGIIEIPDEFNDRCEFKFTTPHDKKEFTMFIVNKDGEYISMDNGILSPSGEENEKNNNKKYFTDYTHNDDSIRAKGTFVDPELRELEKKHNLPELEYHGFVDMQMDSNNSDGEAKPNEEVFQGYKTIKETDLKSCQYKYDKDGDKDNKEGEATPTHDNDPITKNNDAFIGRYQYSENVYKSSERNKIQEIYSKYLEVKYGNNLQDKELYIGVDILGESIPLNKKYCYKMISADCNNDLQKFFGREIKTKFEPVPPSESDIQFEPIAPGYIESVFEGFENNNKKNNNNESFAPMYSTKVVENQKHVDYFHMKYGDEQYCLGTDVIQSMKCEDEEEKTGCGSNQLYMGKCKQFDKEIINNDQFHFQIKLNKDKDKQRIMERKKPSKKIEGPEKKSCEELEEYKKNTYAKVDARNKEQPKDIFSIGHDHQANIYYLDKKKHNNDFLNDFELENIKDNQYLIKSANDPLKEENPPPSNCDHEINSGRCLSMLPYCKGDMEDKYAEAFSEGKDKKHIFKLNDTHFGNVGFVECNKEDTKQLWNLDTIKKPKEEYPDIRLCVKQKDTKGTGTCIEEMGIKDGKMVKVTFCPS